MRPTRFTIPALTSGTLFATYLLIRPYGDMGADGTLDAARAFASPAWVASHVLGALGLAAFAWLALAVGEAAQERMARIAGWAAMAGVVLVLPYYGAETFALHVLGKAALGGDTSALPLFEQVRNDPTALAMFGVGLLLLAVSGVLLALAWQRTRRGWSAWPLGVLMALVLPQFYLPPVGRMAFGVAYAVAALVFALAGPPRGELRVLTPNSVRFTFSP